MSEIREKAVRLLLQAAYEMAADNADSVADIFDCQHGFIDDLRRRAMLKLDKPYTRAGLRYCGTADSRNRFVVGHARQEGA